MPSSQLITDHRFVQSIAKTVLAEIAFQITSVDTEVSIAQKSYEMLCKRGLRETWYYQCPALVLLGARSCISISGREYQPANEVIGDFNLVTIDLSPILNGRWGDCARSFYIEKGQVVAEPDTREFLNGKRFLEILHKDMPNFVNPEMTFHELFGWANQRISDAGFENLDFLGNVGHSIATSRDDRQYIERGNMRPLGDVPFFTFEPHVRERNGHWGFKHENIFFFNDLGRLEEL